MIEEYTHKKTLGNPISETQGWLFWEAMESRQRTVLPTFSYAMWSLQG